MIRTTDKMIIITIDDQENNDNKDDDDDDDIDRISQLGGRVWCLTDS